MVWIPNGLHILPILSLRPLMYGRNILALHVSVVNMQVSVVNMYVSVVNMQVSVVNMWVSVVNMGYL